MYTKEQIDYIISNPILDKIEPEMIFDKSDDWVKKKYLINTERITFNSYRSGTYFNKYGSKNTGLIKNPVLVIDLIHNKTKFSIDEIIEFIIAMKYQICGHDVENEYDTNMIKLMSKHYNLTIEQIGSKIYVQLPCNLLLKGFCSGLGGTGSNIRFLLKFNDSSRIFDIVKKISIQLDIYVGTTELSLRHSDNIKPFYLEYFKKTNNLENDVKNLYQTLLDEQTRLIGHRFYELIESNQIEPMVLKKKINFSFGLHRYSLCVKELFICFIDMGTGKIIDHNIKMFDFIEMSLNGQKIWSVSFEEFLYDLTKSNSSNSNNDKLYYYKLDLGNFFGGYLDLNNNSFYQIHVVTHSTSSDLNPSIDPNKLISVRIFALYGFYMIYLKKNNGEKENSYGFYIDKKYSHGSNNLFHK
jgi:hypothetical protein